MAEEKTKKIRRRFKGEVLSNKMDKTAVVRVDRTVVHPKYQKRYIRSMKYKIHDAQNELEDGDKVLFEECRPLAKGKCWRLVKKLD